MCKNIKSQKNYRILLYTIMEKQRSEVVSGVNVDPTVLAGLWSDIHQIRNIASLYLSSSNVSLSSSI